jgi:hypothetical protein
MAVTDYLRGTGTAADPYIIITPAALSQFFTTDIKNGAYAVLALDIDMTGSSIINWTGGVATGVLDGYGRKIKNLRISGNYGQVSLAGIIRRVEFDNTDMAMEGSFRFYFYSTNSWVDVLVTNLSTRSDGVICSPFEAGGYGVLQRVVNNSKSGFMYGNSTNYKFMSITDSYNLQGAGVAAGITGAFVNLAGADRFNPELMAGLVASGNWVLDGASIPRLKKHDVTSLTSAYVVKGVTKVGGNPKSRSIRAHGNLDMNMIAFANSKSNGEYLLNCGYYDDHVFVTHSDDYGKKFTAAKQYILGDVIHPKTPNGYRYICTTAGASSTAEPTSWPTTGTLTSGSAIFTAQPVYKPETFIAVPVLIDLVTGNPV